MPPVFKRPLPKREVKAPSVPSLNAPPVMERPCEGGSAGYGEGAAHREVAREGVGGRGARGSEGRHGEGVGGGGSKVVIGRGGGETLAKQVAGVVTVQRSRPVACPVEGENAAGV